MDRVGSAISVNQVMAGVAMMLVMGAGLTAIKSLRRRQQQLSRDVETGTLLRSEEDEDTEEEEQARVE